MEMNRQEVFDALHRAFSTAITSYLGRNDHGFDPKIRESNRCYYGDYQSECCMSMGKEMKRKPRELATKVISKLGKMDFVEGIKISGPGFIDIYLKPGTIRINKNSVKSRSEQLKVESSCVNGSTVVLPPGDWVKFSEAESIIRDLEREKDGLKRKIMRCGEKVIRLENERDKLERDFFSLKEEISDFAKICSEF